MFVGEKELVEEEQLGMGGEVCPYLVGIGESLDSYASQRDFFFFF